MAELITVIIPTYNRYDILMETIQKIAHNLIYDGVIDIFIGNDGDKLPHIYDIYTDNSVVNVYVKNGPKRGLGANLNMLLEHVKSDIVLQMDDDHWLEKRLDINRYVEDLRNPDFNMGWVRLFMGEEHDVYSLDTYYRFKAALHGPYWFFDIDSPSLYMASNRPHLKMVSMHKDYFGWYSEDQRLGKTEETFCHQYKTLKQYQKFSATPWIAVPMFGLQLDHWKHVGDSWQKRGK